MDLTWSSCRPYDDILARVKYIEQTDAGLKIDFYKVEKEKKMNKNEELKNVDTIIITRDGNTVSLNAYDKRSGFSHHTTCHKTIAECSPDDIFDFNIGAKLAFDRLYEGYDMTPKPKRKPFNGKIFVGKYPGCRFDTNRFYYVNNGRVEGVITPIDTYEYSNNGGPYIFEDMTDDDLSEIIRNVFYGDGAFKKDFAVYFVRHD